MKTLYIFLVIASIILGGCSQKEPIEVASTDGNQEVEATTSQNPLALHDAVRSNDLEQVQQLVSNQSDINFKDEYGYTPLHIAVRLKQYEISEYLIQSGADVNSTDKYKDTPLLDTTRDDYTDLSKLLICNGAKKDVVDRYDMTPLSYSTRNNDELITEMLQATDMITYCNNTAVVEKEPVVAEEVPEPETYAVEPVVEENENIPLAMAPEFKGLYEALYEEFEPDFEPWNAELTKDDLLFRFNNPVALFEKGKENLKPGFKSILVDFVPRYLKVLAEYRDNINEVRVEGHTSSEYSSAKSEEQRYQKNKVLSQKRADNVKEYIIEVIMASNSMDIEWAREIFHAYGMSYDNLIINADGTENKEASRRVDFKIIRK